MGALPRPEQSLPRVEESARSTVIKARANSSPPRWLVVSGLVIYCSVFWSIIWFAGNWAIEAIAAGPSGPG